MTPREPDRFGKQAAQLWRDIAWRERVPSIEQIAAALRAAESSALERAAHGCESMVVGGRAWTEGQAIAADALFAAARQIRALIPPAAARAAETGKAQGAEARCPFDEQDCLDARQRIAELETALREARDQLCAEHCEWTGSGDHDDQCVKLSRVLRVAPPEREGT